MKSVSDVEKISESIQNDTLKASSLGFSPSFLDFFLMAKRKIVSLYIFFAEKSARSENSES